MFDVLSISFKSVVNLELLELLLDGLGSSTRALASVVGLELRNVLFTSHLTLTHRLWYILQLAVFVGKHHALKFSMLL